MQSLQCLRKGNNEQEKRKSFQISNDCVESEYEVSNVISLPTSKPFESTVGTPAPLHPPLAFFSQFQRVLQSTGALQYVGISRVAVALTAHLNAAKSVCIVHICLTLPL